MTDRDPSDLEVVQFAVVDYLCSPRDADANNHLLMTLVEQGVLTPDEASEACVESPEADPDRVDLFIQGGDLIVMVSADGSVDTMDLT